jgi:hypothetical protein
MNENLSRIVADISDKSKGGEELATGIHRLRDEIKKTIENEDSIFGKFRGLLESLRDIIPDERQRYNAAIKALSTTSKLGRQEIVKAVNDQFEELRDLDKGLSPALAGWRGGLALMESKAKELRDETKKLREKIAQLESEEQGIRKGMAAREKEMALVEKAMKELFTGIGAEIINIRNKVEEFSDEASAAQPVPRKGSIKITIPFENKADDEKNTEIHGSSSPLDIEAQKPWPENKADAGQDGESQWSSEPLDIEVQEKWLENKADAGQTSESNWSSAPLDTEGQKACPMCGGQMHFHASEDMWKCYSCAYAELGNAEKI